VLEQQPLLSAAEFKSAIRNGIDPVASERGFASRKAGWVRKEATSGITFFKVQRHEKAVDPYAGGRFTLEFERSLSTKPLMGLAGRARFDQLLAKADLERVVAFQRRVISSLLRPPPEWVNSGPDFLRETYLENFSPTFPYDPGNLWLRYESLEHVMGWLEVITALPPEVLDRAARMDPGTIYLGAMIDPNADPLGPID
jgi:hypothetical protein